MRFLRIWFLALVGLVIGQFEFPPVKCWEPMWPISRIESIEEHPAYVPIPTLEWRSMLDQDTGTWKSELR